MIILAYKSIVRGREKSVCGGRRAAMVIWAAEAAGGLTGPLWDGLWGAVGGGVIGAWLTIRAEAKRSRTEVALAFLAQFIDQYDELAEVSGLLENVAALQSAADINKVRKFGDWCEIVSATALSGAADGALLEKVGIPHQMVGFYKSVKKAGPQVEGLRSALPGWPNLARYVKRFC
jgi:hypothetical protein